MKNFVKKITTSLRAQRGNLEIHQHRWVATSLALLAMALFSYNAHAQGPIELDSNKPIEIAADSLEVLQEKNMAIFSGAVEALQGNIILRAARMVVYYRQGDEQASAAFGAVKRIEVERNVSFATPNESAKAAKGIYNVDKQTITLIGDVVLTREKNMLRGGQLVYNLKTQKSLLTSGKATTKADGTVKSTGGRVKGVFVPKQ